LLILAVKQSVQGSVRLDDYVPAFAAVSSVRSAFGDKGLPAKAEAPSAPVPGNDSYSGLVYEFQGSSTGVGEGEA